MPLHGQVDILLKGLFLNDPQITASLYCNILLSQLALSPVLYSKQAKFSHQYFNISGWFLSGFHICKDASTSFSHISQTWTISINIGRISMTLILRLTWQKEITAFPQAWKSAQGPCQPPGCSCSWHLFHPPNYRFSGICYPFYYLLEPIHLLAFMTPRVKS